MERAETIKVDIDPDQVGFDPGRLKRLDDHLAALVADGNQVGSLVVVTRGGKIVHVCTTGMRDAARGLTVEADTIWRIYSMTKPITAVAVMLLWEDGLLSPLDPVAKFIPAFGDAQVYRSGPADSPVTVPATTPMLVWHLLTHTSGMTYGFYRTHPVDEIYRNVTTDCDLAEACNRWAAIPLLFEPGSEWNYSRSTDVLAGIVEVVTGKSVDAFFTERIFEPLGMSDTGFTVSPDGVSRLAFLYSLDPRTKRAVPNPDGSPVPTERPRQLAGGDGLVSSAADYHRFTQMLLRRGTLDGVSLLSPRTVDQMTANHLPRNATVTDFGRPLGAMVSNVGRGYGFGVAPLVDPVLAKSLSSVGEYTWGGAASTHFWVDPAEELTVLFFSQVLLAPDQLWIDLRRLVYQALID